MARKVRAKAKGKRQRAKASLLLLLVLLLLPVLLLPVPFSQQQVLALSLKSLLSLTLGSVCTAGLMARLSGWLRRRPVAKRRSPGGLVKLPRKQQTSGI